MRPLHDRRPVRIVRPAQAWRNDIAVRIGLSPLGKNAVGLLTSRRRLFALHGIAQELERLSDERAGIVRAVVSSAAPLSEAYAQRLLTMAGIVTSAIFLSNTLASTAKQKALWALAFAAALFLAGWVLTPLVQQQIETMTKKKG